jgi:glycosyltransferase involved in cell wall biosynthesis
MRVAHVSAGMRHGGAEHVLVELALAHRSQGFEVAILAPPGPLDRDWAALQIERRLITPAARDPRDVIRATRAARAALRAWRPDVVHAHNVKATAVALAAVGRGRRRTPILTTFHGVRSRLIRPSAWILRRADAVAAVSEGLRDGIVAHGMPAGSVQVVHNGVTEIPPLGPAAVAAYDRELGLGAQVIAAVGRLVPQKAHDRYLTAAALVLRDWPQATFLLIGEGELRAELEARARELGISHAVRFTGPRDDARQLIARADLVAFSSTWEGLSMAALEALAAGTPVVSTDVAGMRELLGGGAGTIVAGWEAADLAAAISALLGDPQRRRAMGQTGRRLVAERFSTAAMVRRYAQLYGEVALRAGHDGH